jgi:hypothetical protein
MVEEDKFVICLKKKETILLYYTSSIMLEEFLISVKKFINANAMKYRFMDYTDRNSRNSSLPIVYYTNIPFNTHRNIKLLTSFIYKRVDVIFKIEDSGNIQYLLG